MSFQIKFPYEWQPEIVATQLVMIGQVVLAAVPGEFTTMSGRRMRKTIKESIIKNGGPENTRVIITGLSNLYTSYIATYEEYQVSTLTIFNFLQICSNDREFFRRSIFMKY